MVHAVTLPFPLGLIDRILLLTYFSTLRIAISAVWGDMNLVCPLIFYGEEVAKHLPSTNKVFSFRLMQVISNVSGMPKYHPWFGVPHCDDLAYLFMPQLFKSHPALSDVSKYMIEAWTSFAKTGRPSDASWKEAANRETKDFYTNYLHLESGHYKMVDGYFKETCDKFWKPKIFG